MTLPSNTLERLSAESRAEDSTKIFGFWVYLMTDLVLFAGLFAMFVVLRGNIFGGPTGAEIYNMPYVLFETILLLVSSFTAGLSLFAAHFGSKRAVLALLAVTFFLGLAFIALELSEFARLIAVGHGPDTSGFLSAYFTLVGTHGLHIVVGLVWMLSLMIVIFNRGLTRFTMRKLLLWSLFWHFLDLIWIFIFTIVYLMGIV